MATDTERMVLELSAQMRQFEKAMIDAAGHADRAAQRVERRFEQMNRKVGQDFQRFQQQIATVLATIGVGVIAADATKLADIWTTVGNRIATAGVSAERMATVQHVIADIASRTRSDLDATADLFSRMFRASEDLGASLAEVAAVTEIVSKALAGAAQSERQGAIRQLGQGLGSGRLQGDELRSILENSRPIAEAIAAEFETTVGNLRELGKQGQLESRRVFEAILGAGDEIDAAFQRTTFTVADSFNRLRTEAARFVGTNEQTSASVKTLTALIDFVATNMQTLADATVITATVLGGAFAGVAVARAIGALTQLTITANTTKAALAFFGGPLGLLLTVAGGALAYVATQTDLLASSQQVMLRSADSSYLALQKIASLSEDLATVAEQAERTTSATGELSTVADDARDALDEMAGASADATQELGIQATMSLALAEAERQRTLDTLRGAIADQEATIALQRRASVQRQMLALLQLRPVTQGVAGPTPEEQAQLAEANRLIGIFEAAVAASESLSLETWQELFNLRSEGADADQRGAAASRITTAELEQQFELTVARLRHDAARVAELEDAAEIEQRTTQYIAAGTEASAARAIAESEITEQRRLINEAAEENFRLSQLQDQIDIARIANATGLVEVLQDELEVRRRTRELVDQLAITEDEARRRAEEYVAAIREARETDRAFQLDLRNLEEALELARARGDERAEIAISRRLELEQRIAELRKFGIAEEDATERAEAEVAALERADLQGKFREWFRNGAMAAFDGDFGEFFENWLRDRASSALNSALDEVADVFFELGAGLVENMDGQWGELLSGLTGGALGTATAEVDALGNSAEKASQSLGGVLGQAVTSAANALLGQQSAAAASAATEQVAGKFHIGMIQATTTALGVLAKAAVVAAARLSSVGGGESETDWISALFSSFNFGGGKMAGGPVMPGNWYNVGENGPEKFIPTVPGFIMPNMKGGAAQPIQYVDARVINFTGTSEELQQLKAVLAEDMRTRRGQVLSMVADGIGRREIGRGT